MEALKRITLQGVAFLNTAKTEYWAPLHPMVKTVLVVLTVLVVIAVVA